MTENENKYHDLRLIFQKKDGNINPLSPRLLYEGNTGT